MPMFQEELLKRIEQLEKRVNDLEIERRVTRKKSKNDYSALFEQWWEIYPLKKGKRTAATAYDRATERLQRRGDGDAALTILNALSEWRRSDEATGRFCPHPATWLNSGRYDDDRATWKASGKPVAANATKVIVTEDAIRVMETLANQVECGALGKVELARKYYQRLTPDQRMNIRIRSAADRIAAVTKQNANMNAG